MRVRVSGKQIKIGETLPAGVRARLEEVVAKHFDGGADAHVVFSHDGPFYRADCTLHLDSRTVIAAEGEFQAAQRLSEAADIMSRNPITLQLRYLQTLAEIATEHNSTTVFPLPIDLFEPFLRMKQAMTPTVPAAGGDKPKG